MHDTRVQPISDEAASTEVRAMFEASRALIGKVPNLVRIVAHSPQQARWLLPLMASVQRMTEGTVVEHQLRELAILKTSQLNACAY
jgi:alkylhydroperoxidase family enzyme